MTAAAARCRATRSGPVGVDEHAGVDQPLEQLLGRVAVRAALHGPGHQTDPLRRRGQLVEHPRQRWRQVVDDERGPRIQAQQPGGRPPQRGATGAAAAGAARGQGRTGGPMP